jgi:5,10-methylene-tetrahydrofolate dehydrogenase/methenyl tetrahydrofolate cyclohydrolase
MTPELLLAGCPVITCHRFTRKLEDHAERAAWITPVPGGVEPMTIATLL